MTDIEQLRETVSFGFRPWVRRAGLSIVLVAVAATAGLGWIGERAMWVYIATLLLGGLKVWLGTLRPIAEVGSEIIVLRPLHNLRQRAIAWRAIRGTEQMVGGDRLIVYYDTPRGMRFAALNLNLVKGRREFLALIDERLRSMNFVEKHAGRSRYLSRLDAHHAADDEREGDRK
jgi:hypothetical protein